MFRPISPRTLIAALSLMASACLSPETNKDESDSGATDDKPGMAGEVSIYDVQTGEVASGSTVTLADVVVTSPLTGEGDGFFVQDQGGGEYSGLYVYIYDEVELSPEVGDTLTLTGEVSEFYDATQITVTGAADAYVTGSATPVADLIESEPENWEAWESCLVKLEDQRVNSGVNTYGEVELSIGIPMDNTFVNFTASEGDVIESVTGPIAYSFDKFKINPRSQDDLVGATVGGGGGDSTVVAIQSGEVAEGAYVTLTDVIATSSLDRAEGGFFVQDAGGGEYSGIYIYAYEEVAADLGSLAAGQALTITGQVTEFYDYTEITVSSSADIEVTGSGDVTVDVVNSPSDWEAWEGCLVTVADVTVTSEDDGYGAMELSNGLKLDDGLTEYTAANGESFGTVTGLISYGYDFYRINPRSQDDLDSDGTVPDPDPDPVDEATVSSIQDGTVAEGATVLITAIVTSEVDLDDKGFFVQDAGGGAWSGVYIYRGSTSAVSIGDEVEITGVVTEYYGLTEIVVSADSDIVVTAAGSGVTTDTLATTPSDWEQWEGCLVTIGAVDVTSDDDGFGAVDLSNGLKLDDLLFSHGASSGDSFSELTGLITYSYSAWRINPRAGDL
jgi:predicted extracellular nuclease